MRATLMFLMVAALCAGGAGCDKPDPEPPPRLYDQSIDGSVPVSPVTVDPAVLTERPRMEVPRAPSPQPVEPAPRDREPDPTEQVRAAMEAFSATIEAGNFDGAIASLVDEQAEVVRGVLAQYSSLEAEVGRVKTVAERVLGDEAFGHLLDMAGEVLGVPMNVADSVGAEAMEVVSPTEVRLLDSEGQPDGRALLIDGRWRFRMPDEDMVMLTRVAEHPATVELAAAVEQACRQLADGLERGSVTEANLAPTVNALMGQRVAPAMFGFMMAMQEIVAEQLGAEQLGEPATPARPGPYDAGTGW